MGPADKINAVLVYKSIEGFLAEHAADASLKVHVPAIYLCCWIGPQQVADKLVLIVANWPFDLVDKL